MKQFTKTQMKELYTTNKSMKVGDLCVCPSCGTKFTKNSYQQVFCKTKPKTICKDTYWNEINDNRNKRMSDLSDWSYDHPFSSEGLGQW